MDSVASLTVVWQFLFIGAVNDLPISEKGVIMGRMFFSVCGVH